MAHPKRPASAEEREQRAVIEKLADTYPLLAHLGELDLKNRHFQIFLVLEPLILLGGTPENAL
jgi:hypothetical protein